MRMALPFKAKPCCFCNALDLGNFKYLLPHPVVKCGVVVNKNFKCREKSKLIKL